MTLILPELPISAWHTTHDTLHMWMQIVGKVRLELTPHVNHWWQVPFYLTARGMTTSPLYTDAGAFEIDFDFVDHVLHIRTSAGATHTIKLYPRTVADFYAEFVAALRALSIDVTISTTPVEVANTTPFEQDTHNAAYDAEYVGRFWRVLAFTDRVLKEFRGEFIGKHSPVHFFWGAADMASTRFSGRSAPAREWTELPRVMHEAYSHEVSSAGFWSGSAAMGVDALFYAYHTPEPEGFRTAAIQPAQAYYLEALGEFALPYEAVRQSDDPRATLLTFLRSTYAAGADHAGWDRAALEQQTTS